MGGQRSELDAAIAFLRRQEGSERRACDEDVAARDGEISEAEAQLRAEQRRHERAEFGETPSGADGSWCTGCSS